MDTSVQPLSGLFPRTRWSLVMQVQGDDAPAMREALEKLLRLYWSPLYTFARRSGMGQEDAEDAVQGFCMDLVRLDSLKSVREGLGRLRSFLLAGLQNHITSIVRYDRRQKRGGEAVMIPLDAAEQDLALEAASDATPAQAFDRRWALTLLDLVLKRLRAEFEERGKLQIFELLEPALAWNGSSVSHSETAQQLGMSVGAVHQQLRRMRQRYRELLDEEILYTVETPEMAEAERLHLIQALST